MDQRSVSDYSFVEVGPGEAKDLPIRERSAGSNKRLFPTLPKAEICLMLCPCESPLESHCCAGRTVGCRSADYSLESIHAADTCFVRGLSFPT